MKPILAMLIHFVRHGFIYNLANNHHLSGEERYQGLRRGLLVILFVFTMTPVVVTATVNFFQYQQLLQEEAENNARWSVESASRNLETFLEKLSLSVSITANAHTFEQLTRPEMLDRVFAQLKQDHRGVVDLSVIGPDGIQQAYSGPFFNLLGKNYNTTSWYNKTLARNSYISEVFMGFRKIPHFVVAVSKKMQEGNGHWVLRASIDTGALDSFLNSFHSDTVTDIFLVNDKGQRQNGANFEGEADPGFAVPALSLKKGVVLQNEYRGDKPVIRAFCAIKDTPWVLVLDHMRYVDKRSWVQFKHQILAIFLSCAFLCSILIFRIAGFVASSIRKAEETREAMLAQSEHTNKLASIGRLAAGVAHEINNPLAIISAKSQLVLDLLERAGEFNHREKVLAHLGSLQKAVVRSRDITHRLLGFARRMEVKLEPVQINAVIDEVLDFLGKEALYQNITIERELLPELPAITSDQGQLQQILLNIVNNAIDAAGKGGKIRIVTSQRQPESIDIAITDNGPGMSAETLKKIFEPFFTTKTGKDKQGTGLGLAITYGLVKKLLGEIRVASEVGAGTTFTLTFPVQRNGGEASR